MVNEMHKRDGQKLIVNAIYLLVLLMPLWWITGFSLLIFHLIPFVLYILLIINEKRKGLSYKISKVNLILGIYIIVYICSLLINGYNEDINRILGSAYNLSFWIMGFFLIHVMSKVDFDEKTWMKVFNAFRLNGIAIGILSTFVLIYWNFTRQRMEIRSVLSYILPFNTSSSIISDTLNPLVLRTDWFLNVPMPRLSLFYLYPTALGMGVAICIFFTVIYHKINQTKLIFRILEISIMIIPLLFSFSRIVFLGMLISFSLVKIISNKNSKRNFYRYFSLFLIILACFLPLLILKTNDFVSFFLSSREGSTNLRMNVYQLAINYAIEKNVFIGVGVKPLIEDIRIPIGSHSTFIGTFLKTGIVGLCLILIFNIYILISWIKIRIYIVQKNHIIIWECLGYCLITILIWMITEDIDAPQNISFFYFLILGLIIALFKKIVKRNS